MTLGELMNIIDINEGIMTIYEKPEYGTRDTIYSFAKGDTIPDFLKEKEVVGISPYRYDGNLPSLDITIG